MNLINLDKIKLNDIKKISKIPGIENVRKKEGKCFGVKYYIFGKSKSDKSPSIVRITSLSKSFDKPYTIDIFNLQQDEYVEIKLKPDIPEKEFLTLISKIPESTVYTNSKHVHEKISLLDHYLYYNLNEGIVDKIRRLNPTTIINGMMLILTTIVFIRYWIITAKNKYEEYQSEGPREKEINDGLFRGQKHDEPAFKMYAHLENFIRFVALGKAPAVILYGPPGMSKTYIVRRTFHFNGLEPGKDYSIVKGSTLSLAATYDLLYKNRDRILVLDDFDTPLRNEDTVNLLKSITDSYDKRIVSLPREKMMSSDGSSQSGYETPEKFEYKGKLIIVTNLLRGQLDRALLSRAPAFEVSFNTKQVLSSLEDLLKFINPNVPMETKREVLDYILYLQKKHPNLKLDFRGFKNAVDARVGNPLYWKDMVHTIVGL